MRVRAFAALLLYVSACATSAPSPEPVVDRDRRLANLQRAAALPWTDGGRCVVEAASQPWPVLAERCYHALDHERVEFHDTSGRCAVASAGAAAMGLGVCVLAAPELVVGAVVVTGIVVVGFAIKAAREMYELRRGRPQFSPVPEARPVPVTEPAPRNPSPDQKPKPEPKGPEFPPGVPPATTERERDKCEPVPRPYHRGGNSLHNLCADRIPDNSFPGGDVLVNGKDFDALQLATRTLWEVKTNDIETYNPYVREAELRKQVEEGRHEQALAAACGYRFAIGVRTQAHKTMLDVRAPDLIVVLMDWC